MKSVFLGVSGSIAAYKAATLTRLLRRRDVAVQVAMTPAATNFVGAATFRALSGRAVLIDEWNAPQSPDGMDHIAAVRAAELLLIAPASADFLAKAAGGIADNLLLSAFLAADCRRIVAPAMNQQMWQAAATQRNIRQLQSDGVQIFAPADGEQACGETGPGRMLEAEEIITRLFSAPLVGRRVVINAGATVEYLDKMRLISNRSSGRMGFSLAAAAAEFGAETTLIAAKTSLPPPLGVAVRRAEEGDAMRRAVLEETARADWFFSAAAIADFRPASKSDGKTERKTGDITLTLSPTTDILAEVREKHPSVRCVGFAAQTGDKETQKRLGREKMKNKNISLLVLNDADDAEREDCQLTILHNNGENPFPRLPKPEAARQLLNFLVSYETSSLTPNGTTL